MYVVRGLTKSLLGLPAIEQLNLISRITAVSEQPALEPTVQFQKLFTGLGKLEGDYTILQDLEAKPFAQSAPTHVAVLLMGAVKQKLERMEMLGVITKIQEPTEWCAGMVVVLKVENLC